jgi:hypothetical protein
MSGLPACLSVNNRSAGQARGAEDKAWYSFELGVYGPTCRESDFEARWVV